MNAPVRDIAPISFHDGKVVLYPGDCMALLALLPDNSVDAVCTDPPYHLTSIVKRFGQPNSAPVKVKIIEGQSGSPYARSARGFMGKMWDGGDIAFTPELWAEVLRVLKPGGHMVAFSGTRTYHRMACAIEDAGFEIRDQILFAHETKGEIDAFINSLNAEQRSQFGKLFYERGHGQLFWAFGSGFPKSHNVSRNLDAERCMCSVQRTSEIQTTLSAGSVLQSEVRGSGEAHLTGSKDLPDLRRVMEAIRPIPGGEGQDVLSGLRGEEDSAIANWHNPQTPHHLRRVQRNSQRPAALKEAQAGKSLLQPLMPSQGSCPSPSTICSERLRETAAWNGDAGANESRVEGRGDLPQKARELRLGSVRPLPAASDVDGESGRLCHGAPEGDGRLDRSAPDADRVRASQGSQAASQSPDQSGTVAGQSEPQERGAWDHCDRCGKPIVPDGLGTALKPAHEPICLARKPLSEDTVAANVLRWGTGAINVDACRVAAGAGDYDHPGNDRSDKSKFGFGFGQNNQRPPSALGRFPANLVLGWPADEYQLRGNVSTEEKRELYRWLSENA